MPITKVLYLAAFLQSAFAMPQHAHAGHGPYKARSLPSGFPTGFPHPSGVPGGPVPYPVSNGTVGGPTGTGSVPLSTGGAGQGPVTIQSTINIVPQPLTKTNSHSPASSGVDESGATGSGSSSGGEGSGEGESGASCGPATVTVTQANTVTVTIPAASGGAPSGAPIESSPASSAPVTGPSAAPYPIGNSSVPAGPTGTASVGTVLPSLPYQAPSSTTPEVASTSAAPVEVPSSSAPVVESTSAAPIEAATSATSSASSEIPVSSVVAQAYYHGPAKERHSYVTVQPSPITVTPSVTPVSITPSVTPSPSTIESAVSSTLAAPVSSSSAPAKPEGGLKARGLLYGGTPGSTAISNANTYLSAGNGAMGWGWNWDSSPSPQSGPATGTLDVQFVPMLLSPADTHTTIWDQNSAGFPYLMAFNEPDMTTGGGGSSMTFGDCVTAWLKYMEPKRSDSTKLVSPATTNTLTDANMGLQYMASFLQACIKENGCHIDVLAFHYYGDASDLDYFKNTVSEYQKLQTQYSIPELWITEMAPNQAPTADQMSGFLAFLDDPSSGVSRYAFNGLNTGTGQSLDMPAIQAAYQA